MGEARVLKPNPMKCPVCGGNLKKGFCIVCYVKEKKNG